MMEKSLVVSIFIVFYSTKVASRSVIGTIRENTTWFLSNLSVRPAMTASLEYHVQYPYVEGRARPIITFYYNGQTSPNLISHCETDMYGQLRSEDLAVPLNEPYRGKFFCYENETNKIYHCRGKTKIQDFEPKSYSFSFCNECGSEGNGNLNGLWYNVTIYDESNKTSCVDLKMAQGQRIDRCERSYQYAAIPNQIGNTDLDTAIWELEQALGIMDQVIDLIVHNGYLKDLYQMVCLAVLPECLPEQNKLILPCREDCKAFLDISGQKIIGYFLDKFVLNCDYLPSVNDNATCYSKADICGPPPEIKHGFILEGSIPFAKEGHAVHYACNDSWTLTGSPNLTCQESGEWTSPPGCVKPTKPLSLILIICLAVGGFVVLVLIVTLVLYCCVRHRKKKELELSGFSSVTNRSSDPLVYTDAFHE